MFITYLYNLKHPAFDSKEPLEIDVNELDNVAFNWLKTNGHEDIIKNVVSVQFGRGEDGKADYLLGNLQSQGFSPATKRWVEPMTLKAFVREQVEKGTDLPFETFSVYVGQKSKINK